MKFVLALLLIGCVVAKDLGRVETAGLPRSDDPKTIGCGHRETREKKFKAIVENEWNTFNAAPTAYGVDETTGMCVNEDGTMYNHPSDCTKYVHCSNGRPVTQPCPGGLNWNNKQQICDYPKNANCLVYVKTVSFAAKGSKPGVVDLTAFPGTAKITQVKLEYVSGSVTCSTGTKGSRWGCNNLPPYTYTKEVIGVLITGKNKEIIFQQANMPGYDGNSPVIVFNRFRNQPPTPGPVTVSDTDAAIKIWYNEDFTGMSGADNSGSVECRVYITLE